MILQELFAFEFRADRQNSAAIFKWQYFWFYEVLAYDFIGRQVCLTCILLGAKFGPIWYSTF